MKNNNNTILVFGKTGQIARALYNILGEKAIFAGRDVADFSNADKCVQLIYDLQPKLIINAVAYTQVDKAETEIELAMKVNAYTPQTLASAAKDIGAIFVHYSTDYVFDGSGNEARTEDYVTNPINIYGESKLLGEKLITEVGGKYLIFRTSWVYDEIGKNFFTTMLRLGAQQEQLKIVADQIGAPSYAPHLAQATMQSVEIANSKSKFPAGIYHICNASETSWYGFAVEIFKLAQQYNISMQIKQCLPINSIDYSTPAKRPCNSRLNCQKLLDNFNIKLPNWQIGLNEAIEGYLINLNKKKY